MIPGPEQASWMRGVPDVACEDRPRQQKGEWKLPQVGHSSGRARSFREAPYAVPRNKPIGTWYMLSPRRHFAPPWFNQERLKSSYSGWNHSNKTWFALMGDAMTVEAVDKEKAIGKMLHRKSIVWQHVPTQSLNNERVDVLVALEHGFGRVETRLIDRFRKMLWKRFDPPFVHFLLLMALFFVVATLHLLCTTVSAKSVFFSKRNNLVWVGQKLQKQSIEADAFGNSWQCFQWALGQDKLMENTLSKRNRNSRPKRNVNSRDSFTCTAIFKFRGSWPGAVCRAGFVGFCFVYLWFFTKQ